MEQDSFRRAVWGYDPEEVRNAIDDLIAERDQARQKAATAESGFTELRLNSAKQVEEASAEAAVVLGHARNEATRIREAAVAEADRMRRDGEVAAQELVRKTEEEMATRLADVEERERAAEKMIADARAQADESIRFANSQADKLRADAYEILRSAEQRSQAADNEIRLKRLDAERAEAELVDKADQYSRRVYQDADRHWQMTQKRSEELRTQAEEVLRESQQRASDLSRDSVDSARRLMEETLDQLTRIGSEVAGSMSVISRVRRSVSDQLDRLEIAESRPSAATPSLGEPLRVTLASEALPQAEGAEQRPGQTAASPTEDNEQTPVDTNPNGD